MSAPEPAAASELIKRAGAVIPGAALGALSLPDGRRLVADHGSGPWLWDTAGKRYIDLLLGSGPLILGHAPATVLAAVSRQLARGTTYYTLSRPAIELAERLVEIVPCAEAVRFCSTGSEATLFALRLARAATGRDKILKFEGAFHGNHDYAQMSVAPARPSTLPRAQASSAGIPAAVSDTVLVAPFNDLAAVQRTLARHGDRVAALIVEPVQRAIAPAPGFLEALRELTARHGIVLIFDEVVTGFRVALGGAQELYGVTPDLATFGKALSGGFPIAAVAGKAALMAYAAKSGKQRAYFSGTLSGNPVGCAAALATLDALAAPGVFTTLRHSGERLRNGLQDALLAAGHVACVYGVGPILQVQFAPAPAVDYRSSRAGDRDKLAAFAGAMIDRGVLYTGQKAYLSLAHTERELAQIIATAATVAATLSGSSAGRASRRGVTKRDPPSPEDRPEGRPPR